MKHACLKNEAGYWNGGRLRRGSPEAGRGVRADV
jgi:hypothetical protein